MSELKERSMLRTAALQIAAGGSAGFIEVSLMHPLDLVKTRFQLQQGPMTYVDDPNRYSSIVDCFRKMYRTEGALSFYKGVLPPIFADTPKRAVKFFTFEQYKKLFLFGAPGPTAITFTLAGLLAGITEGLIISPFEVVKVKMQAERGHYKHQSSTIEFAKIILKTDGFHGFGKGLTSTLTRNGIFNMAYFGFYHNVKNLIPQAKDTHLEFARRFVIGFLAGTLGSCMNIPFDVVKSRIQGPQPVPGKVKYHGCLRTVFIVYKEEGIRALYKGLLPKLLRLGPGGGIMLIVFEAAYEKLQQIF